MSQPQQPAAYSPITILAPLYPRASLDPRYLWQPLHALQLPPPANRPVHGPGVNALAAVVLRARRLTGRRGFRACAALALAALYLYLAAIVAANMGATP